MHFSKALLMPIFMATALAAPLSIDGGDAVDKVVRRTLSTATGAVSDTTQDIHEFGSDLRDNLNGAVVEAASAAPAAEDTANDVASGVPVVGGTANSTLTSAEGEANSVAASAPGTLRTGEDTFEAVYTTGQDGVNDALN